MDNKQIYIDGQVFQTAAWHRGMGKYSLELLRSMSEQSEIKLHVVLNDSIELPEEMDRFFSGHKNIRLIKLSLTCPREPREDNNVKKVILQNKKILDAYFDERNIHRFKFLILALYLDEVCPVFPTNAESKLLVYYDSIPYLYHERYNVFKGFFDNFYLPHTATVFEATKLLTISNTVANDLKIFFGIPGRKILNIDGASIPKSKVKSRQPQSLVGVDEFVLMPSGQELRKNNSRAVRAFRSFINATHRNTKLVITSFFTEEAQKSLSLEGGDENIIFTGNVTSEELAWLYENSHSIFFPSEYEGLGLPVLEAVDEKKRVICSDISVFREISKSGFLYFDPLDEDSIKNTLADTLEQSPEISLAEYRRIKKHYSWQRSAKLVLKELQKPFLINEKAKAKPKLAILCPDPSGFSAIGKVVVESHSTYSDEFDIEYFFDKGPGHRYVRPNLIKYVSEGRSANEFDSKTFASFDDVIYHIGNSEYHLESARSALVNPAIVILHDTYLKGLFDNLLEDGYISKQRYDLEATIDKVISRTVFHDRTPTSGRLTSLLHLQRAVVVHSKYAQDAVVDALPEKSNSKKVEILNLPVDYVDATTHKSRRRRLNYKPVIALAGIIAGVKGIDVIESLAQNREFKNCLVKVFGFSFADPEGMQRLALLPNVEITSNPSDFDFQRNMSQVDVLVNVRQEYKGETSLTTLEAMRYGATVIVKDIGWYGEIPDAAVVHVKDGSEVEAVIGSIINNNDRLDSYHESSLDFVSQFHSHDLYAKGMRKIVDNRN